MYLDRTYRPRRRRKGVWRYWPLMLLAALAVILYEQQPAWLREPRLAPTAVPTRSAIAFLADAEIALRSGNVDGAVQAYEEVMRLEPANPKPLAALSAMYLIFQNVPKAQDLAEKAVALAPKDPEALNALARALDWQGDYEAAVNNALDALEIDPKNATTLAILGEIYTDVGNWEVAEGYLGSARASDPENVLALRNIAYLNETAATMMKRSPRTIKRLLWPRTALTSTWRRGGNIESASWTLKRRLMLIAKRWRSINPR